MVAERSHYSEDEAEQILKLAARAETGAVPRDRLLAMAEELGLTEEQVALAESQYTKVHAQEYERALFKTQQRQELKGHIASYLAVNAGLLAMDFFTTGRITWSIWPLLGWGIGILSGIAEVFFSGPAEQEKAFQKWKMKRVELESTDKSLASIAAMGRMSKIEAIKELRQASGLGLKEAKDAVETYASLHPGSFH